MDSPGEAAPPPAPSRRRLLAGAAALGLLVTGCKGIGALGTPPRPLPDVSVLRDAITSERLMIARYQWALAHLPSMESALAPVLSQHRAHLASLRARLIDPHPVRQQPVTAPAPPTPATAGVAIEYLKAAEAAAARALATGLAAVPPSLAQLMASIAASEASHAALLGVPGGIA